MTVETMPRPKQSDPAVIMYAAHIIAGRIVEEWEPSGDTDEWAKSLAKEMRYAHRDGYALARELERYHGVSPDSQLVEILDEASSVLSDAHTDALEKWVKLTGWTPRFAQGDRVRHDTLGEGIINEVKASVATYWFAPDAEAARFRQGGGYLATEDRLTALAAGSRRAETNEDLAQCEASQSGAAKTAQRPTPPIVR